MIGSLLAWCEEGRGGSLNVPDGKSEFIVWMEYGLNIHRAERNPDYDEDPMKDWCVESANSPYDHVVSNASICGCCQSGH
jgi:hypothetical protein